MIKKVDNQTDNEHSSFPFSNKVYVEGSSSSVQVPMREIPLASSSLPNGEKESNSPIRVYDTSGAWGDANFHKDSTKGLPSVRSRWILERNDTVIIDGRSSTPIDNGHLSD